MNFHETQMGKIFFQGQLPKLIAALNEISKNLKRPAAVFQMPQEPRPDFLTALYYGECNPASEPDGESIRSCNKEIIACRKELQEELPAEVWKRVEKYRDLLDDRSTLEQELAFTQGFRYAMSMVIAGLSVPRPAKSSGDLSTAAELEER